MTDATPSKTTLGDLPEWDLSDLYSGVDAPELETDLTQSADKAAAFAERYKGNLASLGGAALAGAIREYEAMDEVLSAVMSFSGLLHAGAVSDPEVGKFYQTIQERVNNIFTPLLFFTLELNRIGEDDIAAKLTDPTLAHYGPWLRDIRAMRPHQLSDEIETLLHEKSVAGRSAWMRLFDETMADLRFPYRNRKLTTTEILDLLSDNDGAARKEAAKSVGIVLGENVRLFSLITNTLAKDKEIDDKWRKFDRPVSSRNLSNLVEDVVVDALVDAVKASYPRLAHRYYKLKASWFGGETLDYWDRNAPLPDEDERVIPWDEAQKTVLDAYGRFSGELADVGQRFFDNAWIDAPARAGKA
ncbi:MAG: oligoendopeptidase F, partial [Rhodospirillaceae bacterium]|nr:oligoendopeptidase F [Rhodospirillaceae bacterium]